MHKIKSFMSGYYNILLACLIILLAIRPDQQDTSYHAVWKFFLTLALLSTIFNVHRTAKFRALALILAIPTIALSWVDLFIVREPIFIANALLTLTFLTLMTITVIRDVLRWQVTADSLKGVVCAYFMISFTFAYLYYLIGYIHPGAFAFAHLPDLTALDHTRYLSQMIYYSFTTILQIGYGDITAMSDAAQTASVIEGLFGQFYIAILVARLVSLYSLREKS